MENDVYYKYSRIGIAIGLHNVCIYVMQPFASENMNINAPLFSGLHTEDI